jgi:hypothetical protein
MELNPMFLVRSEGVKGVEEFSQLLYSEE